MLEFREPADGELDGQLKQIILNATPALAIVENLRFEDVELLVESFDSVLAILRSRPPNPGASTSHECDVRRL